MARSHQFFAFTAAAALCTLAAGCGGDNLTLPDPTAAAQLEAISGMGQVGSVGTLLAEPLVVRVLDSEDRPVPEVRVAFVPGSGAEGSAVEPDTAETDSDGRASVRWALGTATGSQALIAKVVGNTSLTAQFTAVAGAGVAAALEKVSGDGQSAIAGTPLPDSLIVRALDSSGDPVGGVTVRWAATGGGSVSAETSVTRADGRTGVRRTLGPQAGEQGTTAVLDGDGASAVAFTASALTGTAGALRIEVQPPSTARSGAAFTRQPQLQLVDENGNPVQQPGLAVSAAIASGPSGATLTGSTTASTNGTGLAAFTNLGLSGPGGSYTLNFTGPGTSGVTSATIQLSAGEAVKLAMVAQPPASVKSGAVLAPAPSVRLEDATGNGVAVAGVPVTVSLSGGGVLGGTLSVQTGADGHATFNDLTITGDAGERTLLFASNGLQSIQSAAVSVIAVPDPAHSTIVVATSLVANEETPVTVTVRDEHDTPLTNVAVVLEANGSDNTITPASATTGSDGVASFTFKSTRAEPKALGATMDGVAAASVYLAVTPGLADAAHTVADVPGGTRPSYTTIKVETRDAWDNPLTAGGAAITATMAPGSANSWTSPSVADNGDGTYTLTYLAFFTGTDTISIFLDGVPIKGSPFTSEVK
jgi:hypothetical protein